MSEPDLIARARAGDTAAFTALVDEYQRPIYNLCYRMLGESNEAEDAAQEAFLRAYTRLGSYDTQRPFKTWLFSIASHYCIDLLRKRRLIWLSIDDDSRPVEPELFEPSAGPEDASVAREKSEAIQCLLSRLSPNDRAVIVLRYWYDGSYEEIAQVTGTTVSAVKSRLHRAREALAEMMEVEGVEAVMA